MALEDAVAVICAIALVCWLLYTGYRRCVHCLGKDDQLRVQHFTNTSVRNGPGFVFLNPFGYHSAEVCKAEKLEHLEYAKVKDVVTCAERIEYGPQLLFRGPYEEIVEKGKGTSLSGTDYLTVVQKSTGNQRIVRGPCVWYPNPDEYVLNKGGNTAVSLSNIEYIIVENSLSGERSTVRGPGMWMPRPYERASEKKKAITLQDDEYIRVKDTASGKRWVQKGRDLVFLEPTWVVEGATPKCSGIKKSLILKAKEFTRLHMLPSTGIMRRGAPAKAGSTAQLPRAGTPPVEPAAHAVAPPPLPPPQAQSPQAARDVRARGVGGRPAALPAIN